MSTFASSNLNSSVVTMRIANALFFTAFVSAVYFALPLLRRQTLIGALIVSSVPLGMFLIPSTNPSSWAFLSGATLWISLLGYYETKGRRSYILGSLALLATIIGAGARADAAVYAGIAVAAVLVLKFEFTKSFFIKTILPAGLGIISLAFYLSAGQTNALDGLGRSPDPVNKVALLYSNLLNVPELFTGVLGKWRLGWLDTDMPAVVWVGAMGVFFGIVFMSYGLGGIRKVLASLLVLSALWLMPTYISVQSETNIGSQVQPRYILPLVILLAGVAMLRPRFAPIALNRSQLATVIVALSVANSMALHFNLRRYVTGTDHVGMNLDAEVEWWWNMPVGPMGVWVLGSLSFLGLLSMLIQNISARRQISANKELDPLTCAS